MKFIDLFAGAGGLSCGLEMAGFEPILANEMVDQYAKTYRQNHPKTRTITGDIREVCELDLKYELELKAGELDLLAGGPPCQGFSINSPIRTLDDERNHLFEDFLRIAKALKPKTILLENVTGIVQLGRGTVVEQIYKVLQSLGYTVKHRILFAGHYGIPQMRFRTILIGVKEGYREINFPEPTHNAKAVTNFAGAKELCFNIPPLFASILKTHTTVWDAISDLPPIESGSKNNELDYITAPNNEYQSELRLSSLKVWNHHCANLGKINLERLSYIPQGGSWRDIPYELLPNGMKKARRSDHTKRYGRLHPESLCSTVLTKCDPHWGSFFHPVQDRVISVREAARIQSFPDRYKFIGTLTQQYEQVGNAVPPLMAKAIGKEIKLAIGN